MAEKDEDSSQHVETTRTQAFSDAVFAIAITLLVLDLKPPHLAPGQSLGRALLAMWPYYVALLTSFGVIGLMWIHHHRVFRYLDHGNHILLKINLLLMLGVSIVPFPTALLAEYPEHRTSAILHTSVVALDALLFNFLWRYARHHDLMRHDVDHAELVAIDKQYVVGASAYVVLVAVAVLSVPVAICGNIVLTVFFAFPLRYVKQAALSPSRGDRHEPPPTPSVAIESSRTRPDEDEAGAEQRDGSR